MSTNSLPTMPLRRSGNSFKILLDRITPRSIKAASTTCRRRKRAVLETMAVMRTRRKRLRPSTARMRLSQPPTSSLLKRLTGKPLTLKFDAAPPGQALALYTFERVFSTLAGDESVAGSNASACRSCSTFSRLYHRQYSRSGKRNAGPTLLHDYLTDVAGDD